MLATVDASASLVGDVGAQPGAMPRSRTNGQRRRRDIGTSAIDSGPPAVGGALSVDQAAMRLGRDRSRIYALLRSGDLVAVRSGERDELRLDASSVERWAVASSHRQARGRLLTPRNAWAIDNPGSIAHGLEVLSRLSDGLAHAIVPLIRSLSKGRSVPTNA
jgi:excisionase family DNA binding protein